MAETAAVRRLVHWVGHASFISDWRLMRRSCGGVCRGYRGRGVNDGCSVIGHRVRSAAGVMGGPRREH